MLAALFVLTLASLLVADGDLVSTRWRADLVVGVAAVKLHLVAMRFMELKDAPPALRWIFRAWILAVAVVLIALR